jgi:hypothetical protein
MESMSLSFESLMVYLNRAISPISDPRQSSNGKRYSLQDLILGAFSVFFMQCESFLEHQRYMQSHEGHNNAKTLFGLSEIPSDPQIRNVLDKTEVEPLFNVFTWVFQSLEQGGWLKRYKFLESQYLIALDGTTYFSSSKIHCSQCNHRTHQNGKTSYFHSAILPVIVTSDQSEVISLAPEFMTPQDGHEKQDCEVAGAKRWIDLHKQDFNVDSVTLLGDDLYSRQPMCETVLASKMNFIFNCLPSSHPTLYEWLESLERLGEIKAISLTKRHLRTLERYEYCYVNQVPLRNEEPSLLVNWCELKVFRNEEQIYHNSWVTHHDLNDDSVVQVAAAGRCRWKTENENHNILKTKGYCLEHNFGHSEKHLSKILLTLNLLAFLFHTVLQLVDESYQKIRKQLVTRKGFFQDIRSLTKYLLFESWSILIQFMISGQRSPLKTNSS